MSKPPSKPSETPKLKFPYVMHCPSCKAGISIKKKEQIGQRIKCPKCQKAIIVVTPEEDGYIPYGVEDAPPPEPEPEPTEEEIEAKELEEQKKRKKQNIANAKHVASILWLLILLSGIGYLFYYILFIKGLPKDEDGKK